MSQYPWYRTRVFVFALVTSLFAGNKFRALVEVAVVWLWFVVKVKSLSTSVAAMSEPSHENSPDSRSVNSSCSTDSNTDESPVTQRESSRRVRRGPVRLERLVDRQRRANTFYRRKENLMKKVSNLVTYPTSFWNIFLTCNESSFDCEGI